MGSILNNPSYLMLAIDYLILIQQFAIIVTLNLTLIFYQNLFM